MFCIACSLPFDLLFVLAIFGGGSGTGITTNFRDTEDRLPALKGLLVTFGRGIAKAGGGECTFGPAVVDTR